MGNDEKDNEIEDSEFESEEEHESEDSEGSMTIGNTVMPHLEDVNIEESSEEPRPSIVPFLGYENIENDEDGLPLSEVGKKKKATAKPTKLASHGIKDVTPPTRVK